jgi:hypothetical protein
MKSSATFSAPYWRFWIVTTASLHETRLKAIRETWLKHVPRSEYVIVTDDTTLGENHICVGGTDDTYAGAQLKFLSPFMHIFEDDPDIMWHLVIDDDTFVHVDRLRAYLGHLDPNESHVVSKIDVPNRIIWGGMVAVSRGLWKSIAHRLHFPNGESFRKTHSSEDTFRSLPGWHSMPRDRQEDIVRCHRQGLLPTCLDCPEASELPKCVLNWDIVFSQCLKEEGIKLDDDKHHIHWQLPGEIPCLDVVKAPEYENALAFHKVEPESMYCLYKAYDLQQTMSVVPDSSPSLTLHACLSRTGTQSRIVPCM